MLNEYIFVYSTAENIVSEHNKIENETDSYEKSQSNLSALIEIIRNYRKNFDNFKYFYLLFYCYL